MFKLGFASLFTLTVAFAATGSGCDDAKNAYNCDKICDRYKECFDDGYDASACQSRCEDKAEESGFSDKAADCESCIDDKSCTGSTFACPDECIGIVP